MNWQKQLLRIWYKIRNYIFTTHIYVNSEIGDDSNHGRNLKAPKKSIDATIPFFVKKTTTIRWKGWWKSPKN